MSDHYSNDKIDLLLSELKNMTLNQNETLKRIEVQTTKTNGRVTKLEQVASNKEGQTKIIAWAVGVFLIVLASIGGYFFVQIQLLENHQVTQTK